MARYSKQAGGKKRSAKGRGKAGLPKALQKVNWHAAGIDVGSRAHYVSAPVDDSAQDVRCFGTYTADLHALADWLAERGVETVAMESTGVYWIPVFELLEARGFEVRLVEPGKLQTVPGRKTDVLDCQWIQQLHTYGLLQGSFRPDEAVCVLRSYMRQRAMLVQYAGQHVQHMQKALMQMNVQLHHVISDLTGATGQRIIGAILAGERDPQQLAQLRDKRCRKDEATIALALEGHWRDEHLFALKQAWELFHFYHRQLAELDQQLEACLGTFEDRSDGQSLPPEKKRGCGSNAPAFDRRNLMYKMTGVDLTTIDGIAGQAALEVVAEIGLDMRRWPTEKHFASWLCLCPGSKKTGGRSISGKTRPSANRVATILRLSATSLASAKCALGAFYRRLKSRLGPAKAVTATAHKLALIIYNMLKYGKPYIDRGAEYYEQQYRQRVLKNLARRAAQFNLTLTPIVP